MKSFSLLMVAVLFTTFYSYAQNTFPATGNVGIGTLSPTLGLLHINGSWPDFLSMNQTNPALAIQFNAYNNADFRIVQRSNAVMTLWTNTVERMRIDQNGNVGIGTTAPSSKLQINELLSDSKPGGVVAATKSVFKLSRFGTPNYSYNESAEFRIGHGGPSVWGSKLELFVNGGSNQTDIPDQQVMTWLYNGNVGIGTSTPQETLSVNGNIRSKQVKVEIANWPDYVFKKDYQLPSLTDVKAYIDKNQHLPEIPSEAEIAKNGLDLGEMNRLLLKKVEELTLYMIEKDKKEKETRITKLENTINNGK
jgi:hypothetical protein